MRVYKRLLKDGDYDIFLERTLMGRTRSQIIGRHLVSSFDPCEDNLFNGERQIVSYCVLILVRSELGGLRKKNAESIRKWLREYYVFMEKVFRSVVGDIEE